MSQPHSSTGTESGESSLRRMWEVKTLPCPEHARSWKSILKSKTTKQALQNYALHAKALIACGIQRSELDLSGVVLLVGAPGTGKTTLAKGFANVFAETLGKPTRLFAMRTQNMFSEFLGQSAKEIGKAFESLRFAAQQGPTVMLVDEIEAISFARNKVINTSDPTDLVRFVDQLLQEIDSLQRYSHAVVVGTSNFSEVIDDALWSRADLVLSMPLPDEQTRLAILRARAQTLSPLGLRMDSAALTTLAQQAAGLSGRTLGKVFAQTYFGKEVDYDEMSPQDVLATITPEDVLVTITELRMKEKQNGSSSR